MATTKLPAAFGRSWTSAQDRWGRLRMMFPLSLSDLSEEVLKQFIQAAVPGVHKINWGEVTLEFEAAKVDSKPASIAHGLGAIPTGVSAIAFSGGANGIFIDGWERTNAIIKISAHDTLGAPGLGVKIPVLWVAIV